MRSFLKAAAAILLLGLVAGCVPPTESGGAGHPNPIIVRDFTASPGVVILDPSFGFSLYRGAPGVPPRRRAASVARAAAFSLADAIATNLAALGYDAFRSDTATADPGGRALIVSGSLRRINEGRRRQGASVDADIEISYQATGAAPQQLTAFHHGAGARAGAGVSAAAAAVGHVVADYVADVARSNNWPAAGR